MYVLSTCTFLKKQSPNYIFFYFDTIAGLLFKFYLFKITRILYTKMERIPVPEIAMNIT